MYLTFRSGGARLALPLARSREVLPAVAPRALPGALPAVRGILLREGVVVPILDLVALGSGRASAPDGGEAVVVDAGETRLGMLVAEADAAPDDGPAPGDEDPPEGWTWLSGRVIVAGQACWLLDAEALARAVGA